MASEELNTQPTHAGAERDLAADETKCLCSCSCKSFEADRICFWRRSTFSGKLVGTAHIYRDRIELGTRLIRFFDVEVASAYKLQAPLGLYADGSILTLQTSMKFFTFAFKQFCSCLDKLNLTIVDEGTYRKGVPIWMMLCAIAGIVWLIRIVFY